MASFQWKVNLVQQTPMIHFQAKVRNDGTLLRATEVKPKLDRFIYDWCRVNKRTVPEDWRASKEHKALDYKMRFYAGGKPYNLADPAPQKEGRDAPRPPVEETTGNLYFGNMGVPQKDRVHSLFYSTQVKMTILCFHPELLKVIKECIHTFFLTENFGTRQNKGFGGFVTVDALEARTAETLLASWYQKLSGTTVYRISYHVTDFLAQARNNQELMGRAMLRDVSAIYQTMKSGFNYDFRQDNPGSYIKSFLTKYFGRRNISGEKRYMKVMGIAPIKGRDPERDFQQREKESHRQYRYIRGLLGASGPQQWQGCKKTINFECVEQDPSRNCARIPSPIFFKVVGTTLFIVPREPLEKVYGVHYKFRGLSAGNNADSLAIPTREEFGGMNEFFAEYVRALNGELDGDDTRQKLKGLSNTLNLTFLSRDNDLMIEKCGG